MATNSLQFWRKQRNVSQLRLAKHIGVEQPMISSIENGEREPSPEVWQQISDLLKVPLDMLFGEPPISFGGRGDVLIERTDDISNAQVGESFGKSGAKSRKVKSSNGLGRVMFLTPSQAKVGVQLQKTLKISEEEWDGVRVWVELPCGDDRQSILETKAEAVAYCQDFVNEEIGRMTQEYVERFNSAFVEKVNGDGSGEEPGFSENITGNSKGISQSASSSDGEERPAESKDGSIST